MKKITPRSMGDWRAVLKEVAPQGKPWIIDGFADTLPDMEHRFKIDTLNRQAHFIAQVAHESDHFKTTTEYASGAAYEGRKDLGNTQSGDGVKFRGRGLIQLTGRYNYQNAGNYFYRDFVTNPEEVATFPWAAMVSGWFWHTHDLNKHADKDDVRAVTRAINGGLNGLDSRVAYLDKTKIALT
jgi:putative chitinase